MAANGGGPPFIKKEEDFDSNGKWNPIIMDSSIEKNDWNCKNRNKRGSGGISIAERRAAKNGFKMNGTTALSPPPYFTVPPGLSPSALLDSPVMLPNAQAHLSPTTGTFHEHSSPNNESLKLMKLKHGGNGESCEAPRVEEQNNIMGENKEGDFPRDDDMMLMRQKEEECFESNINRNEMTMMLDPSRNNNNSHHQKMNINSNGSSLLEGGGGAVRNMMNCGGTSLSSSEDGFLWRKYGQKHVKGSEYPRSYFKCTNTNCPVTKKVERSHNGYVAEIVYSGYHNHPQPQPHPHPHPSKRCCLNNSSSSSSNNNNNNNNASSSSTYLIKTEQGAADHHHRVFDGTTTSPPSSFLINNNNGFLLQQPAASDDHHQNEASPDQSLSFHEELIDDEINNGECEATKRKRESESAGVGRSAREPKLVVQITSDIDILEDGYRWRKYGQKVVKGNPNPRSYYKCTTPGCPVRKHVERAATDIKSVITTYEGKHNHQLPSTKTTAAATLLISSDLANLPPPPAAAASTKPAKQQQPLLQDLPPPPLYLDRKPPILNYNNHLINFSTSSSGSAADLNFGPSSSSLYPLPFPPFHSLPYASLLMNTTNPINTYPAAPSSSNSKLIYPINMNIIPPPPEYMPMPTPIPSSSSSSPSPSSSQVAAGSSSHLPSFHYSSTSSDSYGAHHHHQLQLQPSSRGGLLQETRALVKPKEEQMRDNEDELYDTCLSIPNPPNAPI